MEYGRIIRRSLQITWRHKILWVFGIALALFSGGSRGGGNALQYVLSGSDLQRWRGMMPWPPLREFQMVPPRWEAIAAPVAFILVIAGLVGLFMLVLGVVVRFTSQGALIGMVDELEESADTDLRSGLERGWRRFLRLLAVGLLVGLGVTVVVMGVLVIAGIGGLLAVGPAILLSQVGRAALVLGIIWAVVVGLVVSLALVLAMVAVGAVTRLVHEFAFRACVIDGLGVFGALRAAVALVRGKAKEAGLMWLLVQAINLAVGIVTGPVVLLGVGVLGAPALLTWRLSASAWATIPLAILSAIIFGIIALGVAGIYTTFQSSLWTLTYRELRVQRVLPEAS